MKHYFYTTRRFVVPNKEYEVIEVNGKGFVPNAEARAKTIAIELKTELAGGYFSEKAVHRDIEDYHVVKCPAGTKPYKEPRRPYEPVQKFFKKVDTNNREEMINFLSNHFRYSTMNSWNRLDSYANNMKIHKVIPHQYYQKAFELMESSDFYNEINQMINDFDEEHGYEYQAGFNGRSGGYLVLYTGGKEGNRVFTKFAELNESKEDIEEFSDDFLKSRTELVQELDTLCDNIVEYVVNLCKKYKVVEKNILIPKTIKVIRKK